MSYQALARKWRPRTFAQMVGQEHVLRALINGLDNDRLHHAFLFTGTRGVGKTTVARIFAKALNCEEGVSSEPCGVCSACKEIDEGRFVDLIEVDAASRTKVEDTRDLLENVQYAPTRGRYKVYLIDEVHMLSAHSFNALLKTLEEPPPHVKFLLATTDPQKLPVTILSRCLQFNLKRLPVTLIAEHIRSILGKETVEFESVAVEHLARAADGSMRDALSLVDQGIAFGAGALRNDDVRKMLGSIEGGHVIALLEALAEQDGAKLLQTVAAVAELTPDFNAMLAEMLMLLQRIALVQAVPAAADPEWEQLDAIKALAERLGVEDVQLYYQIGLLGRRDLPLAPEPRAGAEMVLLRMLAFRPDGSEAAQRPKPVAQASPRSPVAANAKSEAGSEPVKSISTPSPATTKPTPSQSDDDWASWIEAMGLRGLSRQLAEHCVLRGVEGDQVLLGLIPAGEALRTPGNEKRMLEALCEYLGRKVRIHIEIVKDGAEEAATPAAQAAQARSDRQRAAEQSIADDPNVRAMQERLGAQLIPNSVQPND
ncbi:MAG: DNA polymerase III subunit gamma/tau [Gammaproteobacteria bacterium]|nr:DNA polymerase III subunit gamma/tau [Gammaproteobacteria bacterium]